MTYLCNKLKSLKYKLKYEKIKNSFKKNSFKKNDFVIYKPKNQKAKILDIHYNDIEPYYSILLNGIERQTVIKNLEIL
jgi:hypothetical protein